MAEMMYIPFATIWEKHRPIDRRVGWAKAAEASQSGTAERTPCQKNGNPSAAFAHPSEKLGRAVETHLAQTSSVRQAAGLAATQAKGAFRCNIC
jgi:hypothetical protein